MLSSAAWLLGFLTVVVLVRGDDDYQYEEYEGGDVKDDDYIYDDYDSKPAGKPDFSNFEAVKIVTKSQNVFVTAGGTINLQCKVENLPKDLQANLIWTRLDTANTIISVGKTILGDYTRRTTIRLDKKGSSLKLILAEMEDAGIYQCRIDMGAKTVAVNHTVRIGGDPKGDEHLTLPEGDDMILSCNTTGTQPVTWTLKDGRICLGSHNSECVLEYIGSVLRINSVRRDHGGSYHCKVGSRAEKEVVVEVVYKPEVSLAEVVMSSISGEMAQLVCKVKGRPTPAVKWSLAGKDVKEDNRKRITWKGERNSLTIDDLAPEDLGVYTCTATNSQGKAQEVIQLTATASSVPVQAIHLLFLSCFYIHRSQA